MAVTVLASACGSSHRAAPPPSESSTPPAGSSPTSSAPASTPPSSRPDLAGVHLRLVRIATLQSPVALAIRNGDPSLYIAEKIGVVVAIRGGRGDPQGNGQRLSTLLAKMLRIAPRTAGGYSVPRDNPFVGRPGVRPEIWAYGLRNPWRYSFDRQTGDLWIGDVGQNNWEEIDFQH